MAKRKTTQKKAKTTSKSKSSTRSRRAVPKRKNRLLIPYPLLWFLLLCVGVALVGLTFKTHAESGSYTVRTKVPASLPTVPAVIESPSDGARLKIRPITVTGGCPTDNYAGNYVTLYRNGIFSGTALCGPDNKFQLQTDLFVGANELKAQIFNTTDDAGPAGVPITVYYDPSKPIVPDTAESLNIPPVVLKTDFKYRGYFVTRTVQWELEIDGGVPPYAINVNWGDGKNSVISKRSPGKFTIEHEYTEPGNLTSSTYNIVVQASDSAGRPAFLQFFVRINPFNSPIPVGTTDKTPPASSAFPVSPKFLLAAWPAYALVVLMTFSFWLGEREEFYSLRTKGAVKKRFT